MPFSSDAFGAGRLPPLYYDLDFKPFSKRLFKSYGIVRASGQPFAALSQPAPFYHIDFRKDTRNPGKAFAPFRIIAMAASTASSAGSSTPLRRRHT